LLGHLQKVNVVGRLESGKSTCRFSFHNRVAAVERTGTSGLENHRRLDPEFANHWHRAYYTDTYRKTSNVIQHRQAVHVHHVRNPVLSNPENTKYTIPAKYLNLIEAIPDCIRPLIRILEGDLFREGAVECDSREEVLPDVVLVSSKWSRCPAIMLGDYVLAGWGELAIAGQENHDSDASRAAREAEAHPHAKRYAMFAYAVGALSIGMMAFSSLAFSVLAPLAISLGVASMFLSSKSVEVIERHQPKRSTSISLAIVARTGCVVFASQGVLFALLESSFVALMVALLLGILAIALRGLLPNLERSQQ
jgi:hypothetical protein